MDKAMVVVFAYGGLSPIQSLSAIFRCEYFHLELNGKSAYHMS